ncbi:hypothetical protein [Paraburkholderia caledonica]|uniref:Uncharacterized protein n=1 Tax=Paraburkholderia caledonica TaxID=134536 RepID=A0AB73IM75_9BURK|nr:hypothetical protein [Paraburkholderia caledonica]
MQELTATVKHNTETHSRATNQQNAAVVEQASPAAQAMAEQSSSLREAVRFSGSPSAPVCSRPSRYCARFHTLEPSCPSVQTTRFESYRVLPNVLIDDRLNRIPNISHNKKLRDRKTCCDAVAAYAREVTATTRISYHHVADLKCRSAVRAWPSILAM